MKIFPCLSFYQIELDVQQLSFPKNELRCKEMARTLFYNYTKRNSISPY